MKRRSFIRFAFALTGTMLVAGCAPQDDSEVEQGGPAPEGSNTVSSANHLVSGSLLVDSMTEAVRAHKAAKARAARANPEVAPAVERFTTQVGRYGMSGDHTFQIRNVNADSTGERHARLDHYYKGVRVLSSAAIIHTDSRGATQEEDTSHLLKDLSMDTRPGIAPEDAKALVASRPERAGTELAEPQVELVIHPVTTQVVKATGKPVTEEEPVFNAMDVERRVVDYKLAYEVRTLNRQPGHPPTAWSYLLDAHTGELLHRKSLVHQVAAVGRAFNNRGNYLPFSDPGEVPMDVTQFATGHWEPFDGDRNFGVWDDDACRTCDANDLTGTGQKWGDFMAFKGDSFASLDNRRTAIADGYHGMQAAWNMIANVFGRRGYDGSFYPGHAFVHSDTDWDDASYSSFSGNISVGDGGPTRRSARTSLDTVAHEFGHGLNDFTADLGGGLFGPGEGDGLNEASSDIIGEITEAYDNGNPFGNNVASIPLLPGPDWVNSGSGRSFTNPRGPHYWYSTIDQLADVHIRAMPMDHAFFFLSQGSSSDPVSSIFSTQVPWGMGGIGIDKAARIWMQALLTRFSTGTDYADARVQCLAAAGTLFGSGSPEQRAVANAFAAIAVGTPAAGYPRFSSVKETEPNNTSATAMAVPGAKLVAGAPVTGALTSRTLVVGSVSAADPSDFYRLGVPAGRRLRVTLQPLIFAGETIVIRDAMTGNPITSTSVGGAPAVQLMTPPPTDALVHSFTIQVLPTPAVILAVPSTYELWVDVI